MALDPRRLTPGVLDGAAEHAFLYGACGALALALHESTGWPIVAITDSHNVFTASEWLEWRDPDAPVVGPEDAPRAGGGSAVHWCVMRPDGMLVDVFGAHHPDALVERYADDADDGEAAWGVSTVADCREWYIVSQGEPIPVALARTFVEAVLARAAGGPEPPRLSR